MSSSETVEVMEECRISPPPNAVIDEKKTLPLTFFDLIWLHLHDVQTLYFYRSFPHSTTTHYFKETIIPSLKHSLSLALTHFFPFAGNLVFPPNLRAPELQYEDGDSVSVTFAESSADFDDLVKNHPREVSRFHPLIPNLPPPRAKGDTTLAAPVFAVQVTLFPGSGISLGFTMQHVAADGNSFVRFIKLWASINKQQQPSILPEGAVLPSYDRTMVKDPNNVGQMFWEQKQKIKFEGHRPFLPTSNFLGGFVLSEADLQRLKERVKVRFPTLSHVSSFTVSCAYTWSCMIKASARSGEEMMISDGNDELEHLIFPVDFRHHLDPPLPENYFGNWVGACFVTAKRKRLNEEDGFEMAANLIGEAIRERLGRKEGAPVGLEDLLTIFASINMNRLVGVAGSPKFAVYDIDFGFGRLQKREFISIDETMSISLHEGKDNCNTPFSEPETGSLL